MARMWRWCTEGVGAIERTIYLWLLLMGIVALALGLRGDACGWWNAHAYLANVVAALTGAAFGVPVLGTIVRRAIETGQRNAVRGASLRRAATSTSRICSHIHGEREGETIPSVGALLETLRLSHNLLLGEELDRQNPYFTQADMSTRNAIVRRAVADWADRDLVTMESFGELADVTNDVRRALDLQLGFADGAPLPLIAALDEFWQAVTGSHTSEMHRVLDV